MSNYEYNKKYAEIHRQKLDQITLTMPKGQRETIKAYAEQRGESVNGFINRLINEEINNNPTA